MRFGQSFSGRMNDILIWSQVKNATQTMQLEKDFVASGLVSGYSFDDTDPNSQGVIGTQAFTMRNTYGSLKSDAKAKNLVIPNGVYRGLVYGAEHRWKSCPGIDPVLSPESVCSNTAWQEHGVCITTGEESDTTIVQKPSCKCNDGFAGSDCSKTCPGSVWKDNKIVPCNGRGKCATLNGGTQVLCTCDVGWGGRGCETMCPGWKDPPAPGQLPCSGFGDCKTIPLNTGLDPDDPNDDTVDVRCTCRPDSNHYGLACEYEQGKLPLRGCDGCVNPGEACQDDTCVCTFPFYPVGDFCEEAFPAGANMIRADFSLVLGILLVLMTLLR